MIRIFLTLFFINSLLSSCSHATGYEKLEVKMEDLEKILEIDSLEYARDFVFEDSMLYIVGYSFTGSNSSVSKVICVDLTKRVLKWQINLDSQELNLFRSISKFGDDIYVSGVSGSYISKDNSNLTASVFKLNLMGEVLEVYKSKKTVAQGLISKVNKLNSSLYFIYNIKDESTGNRSFETQLVVLTEKLRYVKTKRLFNSFLTSLELNTEGDYLYASGIYNEKIKLLRIDGMLRTVDMVPKNSQVTSKLGSFRKEGKLKFAGRKKSTSVTHDFYSLGNDKITLEHSVAGQEEFTFSRFYCDLEDTKYFCIRYNKLYSEIIADDSGGIKSFGKLDFNGRLLGAINPYQPPNATYIVDGGPNVVFYRLK